jgi:hypothetical protein
MGRKHHFAQQQFDMLEGRNGSKASFLPPGGEVRFAPESDHLLHRREMTRCAISDQVRCSKALLLEMAQAWIRLAEQDEANEATRPDTPEGR